MIEYLDNGSAPEFYVDDVAFVDNLGTNCRAAYFTYVRMPGRELFERVVVVKIIRPKRAVAAGKIGDLMLAQAPQQTVAVLHS